MSDVKNIFEKNSVNQPKRHFPRPLMDERGKNDLPPGMTKGGEKMELDPKEIQRQQKAIGRNLNQLTTLANMGRIHTVYLSEVRDQYAQVSQLLSDILMRKR